MWGGEEQQQHFKVEKKLYVHLNCWDMKAAWPHSSREKFAFGPNGGGGGGGSGGGGEGGGGGGGEEKEEEEERPKLSALEDLDKERRSDKSALDPVERRRMNGNPLYVRTVCMCARESLLVWSHVWVWMQNGDASKDRETLLLSSRKFQPPLPNLGRSRPFFIISLKALSFPPQKNQTFFF